MCLNNLFSGSTKLVVSTLCVVLSLLPLSGHSKNLKQSILALYSLCMRLDSAPAGQVYLRYLINSKKNPHEVLAASDTFLFQKNKINLDKLVFDVNDEYSSRNPYILMANEDMNGIKEKIQTSWLAPNDDRRLFLFNHFVSRHPVGTFKKALNGVNTRGYGGTIVSPSSSCEHHPDKSNVTYSSHMPLG